MRARILIVKLDELIFNMSLELYIVVVVSDTVATSIAYVHSVNDPLKKTLHYTIDIMSLEAELFALRCGINQATQIPVSKL